MMEGWVRNTVSSSPGCSPFGPAMTFMLAVSKI
jgi:hypothetical protein